MRKASTISSYHSSPQPQQCSTSRRTCSSWLQTPCCFRDGMAQMLSFPEKWIAASRLPSGERLILKIPSCVGTVCAVSTKDLWIERAFRIKTVLGNLHVTCHHEQWRTANLTQSSRCPSMRDSAVALASFLPTLQSTAYILLQTYMCNPEMYSQSTHQDIPIL